MRPLPALYVWQLFRVDYEKGQLFWKERPKNHFKTERACNAWNARFAGERAGSPNSEGYRHVRVDGTNYKEHRLIWVLAHGRWPSDQLDHINQDRTDNRLENLREATNQENQRNATMQNNNTSGVCGVRWHKQRQKWQAYIAVDGRVAHLGLFEDIEDAKAARKAADKKYGFDPNHGRAA